MRNVAIRTWKILALMICCGTPVRSPAAESPMEAAMTVEGDVPVLEPGANRVEFACEPWEGWGLYLRHHGR